MLRLFSIGINQVQIYQCLKILIKLMKASFNGLKHKYHLKIKIVENVLFQFSQFMWVRKLSK